MPRAARCLRVHTGMTNHGGKGKVETVCVCVCVERRKGPGKKPLVELEKKKKRKRKRKAEDSWKWRGWWKVRTKKNMQDPPIPSSIHYTHTHWGEEIKKPPSEGSLTRRLVFFFLPPPLSLASCPMKKLREHSRAEVASCCPLFSLFFFLFYFAFSPAQQKRLWRSTLFSSSFSFWWTLGRWEKSAL